MRGRGGKRVWNGVRRRGTATESQSHWITIADEESCCMCVCVCVCVCVCACVWKKITIDGGLNAFPLLLLPILSFFFFSAVIFEDGRSHL